MISKLDSSNLRQAIIDSPGQFEVGFNLAKDIKLPGNFKSLTFHGEGGSAFPVSLVMILVRDEAQKGNKISVPVFQNHTYSLTPENSSDSVNVFCSYSGNTEEVISTLNRAISKGLPAIGVACGGELEEICKEKNIPFIKLPLPYPEFQPRMGSGYFVGVILQLLINHGLVNNIRDEVFGEAHEVAKLMDEYETTGKNLADKISGKTPVIWSSQKYKELARVWSIKFNEHAKNPAFWNFFPELNHNSMVGYTNMGDRYFAIMLRDVDDDPQNLKRYEITADILKGYKMESAILDLKGANTFSKIFSSIYIADFAAYYLAEKNEVDPTPVVMVEELKKRLKG